MAIQQQSIVAQWNEITLEAIREGSAKPTETTYQLHLASSAIYDAWAAIADKAYGHYSEITTTLTNTQANKAEAVSFAAYAALSEIFPDQLSLFDGFMTKLGYDPADASTNANTGAGLGTLAAQNVFAARKNDGSNAENDFADTTGYTPVNTAEPGSAGAPGGENFNPNLWQPLRVPTGTVTDANGIPIIDNDDPASYVDQIALTPHWGGVDSFALASNDQFRPDAPPQLGDFSAYVDGTGKVTTNDQAYRDQIANVIALSANLTNEQKVVAELWADGPRTESPPGHWNQIAQDIALREGHGIDEDAKMFFALNAAVFDAGIATWEAKYVFDYVRPQSAIRDLFYGETIEAWGGVNQGTQQILAQDWQPYQNVTFVTPPFPEYVSGHSTFSMAAAKTIASFVGSDTYYDGTTLSNYDLDAVAGIDLLGRFETNKLAFEGFGSGLPVVLQWDTLTEAAEEAGISRLFGGIHIQDGNLNGLQVGKEVAANAEVRWEALFTRGGDDTIIAGDDGGLIIAGAGDDVVNGRRGNDIVEGGSGDDLIKGHRGDDTLEGGQGDDTLRGGRGDDRLEGGAGDDLLFGERDDDTLLGGAGDDVARGGRGDDLIEGGLGDDELFGNRDDDTLRGGEGDDRLNGDRGDDHLEGGNGYDKLFAGLGDDKLMGGDGNDLLYGGEGDDLLMGGDGVDRLKGGEGEDTFVFAFGDTGRDIILDFDAQTDHVLLKGFAAGATLSFVELAKTVILAVDNQEIAQFNHINSEAALLGATIEFHDAFLI
ncbi:hypothetical protein ROLI_037920 [Roseobacter fucihabitans]|uniref:Uncharacterized protein n=1 Tax=Roseobacter fucihabitans TaxID=1537242 RepID=A0ABZ2BZ72_9RHOB|nr:hypothetical protein [Roseobacter litoralis]MBC6967519.1 Hemolysin, chromosomal [Roseobacter litoralis]